MRVILYLLFSILWMVLGFAAILLVLQSLSYHIGHDSLTNMQIFKMFWYKYLLSGISCITSLYLMLKEKYVRDILFK